MAWFGFVALCSLLLVARRLIFWRWRGHRLSHRQAALLLASLMPLALMVAFAISGFGSVGHFLFVAAIALLVFGSGYASAEFLLRAMGGEMDPPASSSYRRRP